MVRLHKEYPEFKENAVFLQASLDNAARNGQMEVCRYLLEQGADINYHDPASREFGAIEGAVMGGKLDIVKRSSP